MLLTPQQSELVKAPVKSKTRGISPNWARLWDIPVPGESSKVGVPYRIDQEIEVDPTRPRRQRILDAMKEIEDNSCIR